MYLLDTKVVSELRRPRPNRAVLAWLAAVDESALYLSAMTLGEIQAGIELTREQDPAKAVEIEGWLDQLGQAWNVLPLDGPVCRSWGRLMHRRSDTLFEDALIAATALAHGLTVVTRNVGDFRPFGVPVLDPFESGRA